MGGLSVMLVVVSLFSLLGGVAALSQTTMGVGRIATACFLAILPTNDPCHTRLRFSSRMLKHAAPAPCRSRLLPAPNAGA
jgi:hypothetical protein